MDSFKKTTRAILGLLGFGKKATPRRVVPLQTYLDDSYKKVKDAGKLNPDLGDSTKVAIAIYLLSKGPNDEYAGKFDVNELQFSGSLMKVAAMFAAFRLRKAARDLIVELRNTTPQPSMPTAAAFFARLEPKLNLASTVPQIATATGIQKKPHYDQVLTVTGFPSPATLAVDLSGSFNAEMRKMMIKSNNCSAGECIWRLSYPYINVALMEDGFFDSTTMKGIWLCGDFIETHCSNLDKKQEYLRLVTENDCNQVTHDCKSAQDTTAKPMARLFFKILRRELVDPESSDAMMIVLRDAEFGAAEGHDPSFLSRHHAEFPLLFQVDGVKIGIGPLKPNSGRTVTILSEGIIITWRDLGDPAVKKRWDDLNLTGRGAICWQNLNNGVPTRGVAEIINTAIDNYIKQAPI